MSPNDYTGQKMQVKTMGEVGALVRAARATRGMTQAELAAQLRVSRDWVVRLEKGHPRLEAQRVLDALRVVGVSLEAATPEVTSNARKRTRKEVPDKSKIAGTTPATLDPFEALFGSKEK